jgi:leucine dehydrogenase
MPREAGRVEIYESVRSRRATDPFIHRLRGVVHTPPAEDQRDDLKSREYMQRYHFEQFVVCDEPSAGLKAFIAIHDTTLGPASGGVRIWPHSSEEEAKFDVLRLARAMTYKSAVAGLSLGGGKGLVVADPSKDKNEALLRAFGRHVDKLDGRYITTEDVGMTPADLVSIAKETEHVAGLPLSMGGGGDTSELTGLGVYLGMKASAKAAWGTDALEGRVVAMQGFGNVGSRVAQHLLGEGARLVVSDVTEVAVERARELGAAIVEPDAVFDVACDIFSPCALGGVLNGETIPRLRCAIVAGGANNQLLEDRNGGDLQKRGILYAPDYVINAGGIINVACEIDGPYRPDRARELTERIYDTTERVIRMSREEETPTNAVADRIAERRLVEARRKRESDR